MSKVVIQVENLGKRYLLGLQKSGDFRQTFRLAISDILGRGGSPEEEFWALRELNFEVRSGEVVGVIGHNGAGKSTLLKILARITGPTVGKFEIDGRVSSLLEVGTGFHSELTGRENIFLNGTILGMRREEIRKKFDEIVAFSGIEPFLDTAAKHYSSGMRVRLAFSIAAHLEPEILIIDEVLAVGDVEFQKKCLGKMDEVSRKQGRTILFVSHNLAAIEHLCSRAILLEHGRVTEQGAVSTVVNKYLHSEGSCFSSADGGVPLANGVVVRSFHLVQSKVEVFDDLDYELTIESRTPNRFTELVILIYNHLNERVGIVDLRHKDLASKSAEGPVFTVKGKIRDLPLMEGTYHCGLFVSSLLCRGDFLNIARFEVKVNPSDFEFVPYASRHRGYLEFNNSFLIH